jgi:hypothetical protein
MLRTVTGPLYAGSLLLSANKDVKAILGTLGKLNDPETQMKIKGLQNLTPFVKKMEGFNGMVEQFKSLRIFSTKRVFNHVVFHYYEISLLLGMHQT